MIAAILLAAAVPQVIVIDNRAEQCEVSSRIAEGNRRRARIEAYRLARDYKAQGIPVRIVTLEAGERITADAVLVSTDCR